MKLIGPVLVREGGFAFAVWESGALVEGFPYRRLDDAAYARRAELRAGPAEAHDTSAAFEAAVARETLAARPARRRAPAGRPHPPAAPSAAAHPEPP